MCDEVNEEDAVHQVDKVDEVHQVDLAHQMNKIDEVHRVHPLHAVHQKTQAKSATKAKGRIVAPSRKHQREKLRYMHRSHVPQLSRRLFS